MHDLTPGLLLGYHGCRRDVADRLVSGAGFRKSENDYDWLGHGIYVWEANPKRALEFAKESALRKNENPDDWGLVGTVVSLKLCLDLTTKAGLDSVQTAYVRLRETFEAANALDRFPSNHPDLLRRYLDCAVINHLHKIRVEAKAPVFDSVRGVFIEGKPLYESSGFHHKTHIQIAIRNPECIKGVFRVPKKDLD